jgi:hypothetical protein
MSNEVMSQAVSDSVREGSAYGLCTKFMRKKQIYTKTEVTEFFKSLGKSSLAAVASMGVMLSPRKESKSDCRGNISNPWGHLAYNEKLARKVSNGVKEEQRFRFRMRDKAMGKKTRNKVTKVKAEKVVEKVVEIVPEVVA